MRQIRICFFVVAKLAFLFGASINLVHAESPMLLDDAGTLGKGGMKFEGAWRQDDRQKGLEGVFGFAPVQNLELSLAMAIDRDSSVRPATRLRAAGFTAKWVPIQNETGWSFGFKFDLVQTRVNDRETPQKYVEREMAISGLATYRHAHGQALHLNLGAARSKALNERNSAATWGIGAEFPLAGHLKLTAELFGQQDARPDKSLGLRYQISEGIKISGAVGRGNDRNFGQLGFAWEF